MDKYKWLPELFVQLDDLYRYAEFAGLDNLKEKIKAARQIALEEAAKARVGDNLSLAQDFGKSPHGTFTASSTNGVLKDEPHPWGTCAH